VRLDAILNSIFIAKKELAASSPVTDINQIVEISLPALHIK